MPTRAATHLMFSGDASSALDLYASVFPSFHVDRIERYGSAGPGAEGTVRIAEASLSGHALVVIDSPVKHAFTFTPAVSLFVECESAEELDGAFARLSAAGQVFMAIDDYGFSRRFGWCSDRFGVSWQLNLPYAAAMDETEGALERLLAAARLGLSRPDPTEAYHAMQLGARLVDIRPEFQRRRDGEIPGAIVVERNHLEWRLHPGSSARISEAVDFDVRWIVLCDEGYASSLAAATLQQIGLRLATDVAGGFRAWRSAGLPIGVPGVVSAPRLAPGTE